ncbi:alpha-2,8-polysialyltransferase family protein [Aestuariivivens sediminicola]|uniref:alpha-2,8-polysialyltransferase family protein n=1 Tax=Aestuariivivens sediminicola TaxID=2913560 RepID=UPI001F59F266|nr:alpha-2,8-polysialyltransferase family protein [Aestuariivivens sediminicola]
MDIAAINGTWQCITFLNFYQVHIKDKSQSCDVILFEVNEDISNECIRILRKYDFINGIVSFNELHKLQKNKYINLWIGKLFSKQSKDIADSFSSMPILLFEEGLHSYVPVRKFTLKSLFLENETFFKKVKIIGKYFLNRSLLLHKYGHLVLRKHEKRVIGRYFLLPLVEPKKKNDVVNNFYLKDVIQKVSDIWKFKLERINDRKIVIIVGQCFSNYDLVTKDFEFEIYLHLISYYLDKKCQVYWKGHPRNHDFDYKFKNIFKDKVIVIENNLMPLECLLYNDPQVELCGISSSSLMYNQLIFKGRTRQLAEVLLHNMNNSNIWFNDFKSMFSIVINNIPRLYEIE